MGQKYATLVVKDYVATLQPKLSGKYHHHDDTEINVDDDCEDKLFWETIGQDTRFIVVAHLLSEVSTSNKFHMRKQD